jgi:nitrogen regulatory protein PII 2
MNKMNQTKRALSAAGITSLHAKDCLGRGKASLSAAVGRRGAEYEEKMAELGNVGRLIPKRMNSIVVPDKLVKKTVDTTSRRTSRQVG